MDISTMTQLISSVGFPIAVCLVLFWYVNKLTETHKEEMKTMREAIENNTLVMQKVLDRLETK